MTARPCTGSRAAFHGSYLRVWAPPIEVRKFSCRLSRYKGVLPFAGELGPHRATSDTMASMMNVASRAVPSSGSGKKSFVE